MVWFVGIYVYKFSVSFYFLSFYRRWQSVFFFNSADILSSDTHLWCQQNKWPPHLRICSEIYVGNIWQVVVLRRSKTATPLNLQREEFNVFCTTMIPLIWFLFQLQMIEDNWQNFQIDWFWLNDYRLRKDRVFMFVLLPSLAASVLLDYLQILNPYWN